MEIVGINQLNEWHINFTQKQPSSYYLETIKKLKLHFDLLFSEPAKSLLIDAVLLEAIDKFSQLKIWKEAPLKTNALTGVVNYLIAQQGKVYQAPLLCIIEAKKDDFKQGLAQCLREMYACQLFNQPHDSFPIYGIITNLRLIKFAMKVRFNSETQLSDILGILTHLFSCCEQHLLKESS